MSLTLYDRQDCPFCWKVRLALGFAEAPFRRVTSERSEPHPDVLRLNPDARIPVLCDGDEVLFGSAAIAEFINETYAEGRFLPWNAADRARHRELHEFVDRDLGPKLFGFVREVRDRPTGELREEIAAKAELEARETLTRREDELLQQLTEAGGPSLLAFALYPRLSLAAQYGANIAAEELMKWREAFSRAALRVGVPDGDISFDETLKNRKYIKSRNKGVGQGEFVPVQSSPREILNKTALEMQAAEQKLSMKMSSGGEIAKRDVASSGRITRGANGRLG